MRFLGLWQGLARIFLSAHAPALIFLTDNSELIFKDFADDLVYFQKNDFWIGFGGGKIIFLKEGITLINFIELPRKIRAPAKLNGMKKMTNKKTQYLDYQKGTSPFKSAGRWRDKRRSALWFNFTQKRNTQNFIQFQKNDFWLRVRGGQKSFFWRKG